MLAYALRLLGTRRTLWVSAAGCAFLAVLPATLAATILAPSAVALIVAGDPALALHLLPEPLRAGAPVGPLAWSVTAVAIMWLVWSRLYAVALWLSDADRPPDLRAAARGTRGSWRGVALLYGRVYGLLALASAALLLATGSLGAGTAGGSTLLVALLLVLVLRTLLRIVLTLAVRACVLEGVAASRAWATGRALVGEHRGDVLAAWLVLACLGLVVWEGGRLLTPALQETAMAFPHDSVANAVREGGQLVVAVTLETFLLAIGLATWTGVFRQEQPQPTPRRRERRIPVLVPAVVLVITLIGNALPTFAERQYDAEAAQRLSRIEEREIRPEAAVRPPPRTSGSANQVSVDAELTGDRLSWTTRITYRNATGETLDDLALHVYPAAFSGEVEDLPLAPDLLISDLSGTLRENARSGTVEVERVVVDGEPATAELDETALVIPLDEALAPGKTTSLRVSLRARLPTWPERFGIWGDRTLLGNWIPAVARREEGVWRLDPYGDIGDPFFSDVADYDVTLEVDEGEQVVGSGTLVSVAPGAGGRQRWRFTAPAHRDAAFAVGPTLRGIETRVGDTYVRSWYPADERALGAEHLGVAAAAVAFYSDLYGELPFDEVEVVESGGFLGGMEYPGVMFVSSGTTPLEGLPLLPDLLRFAGFREAASTYAVAHEVAHQWWYAAVGNDQIREPWLDEAFAEYSTRRWLRARDPDERVWAKTNFQTDVEPGAVVSKGTSDYASNAAYTAEIYLQGAEVLFELRRTMGAETFDALLREWYRTNVGGVATLDAFARLVELRGGEEAASVLERFR